MRNERTSAEDAPTPAWWRANGLAVLVVVVVLGILPGAGYLHWRAPEVRAEIAERMAAAPEDPDERLDLWLRYGEPQIQSRLTCLRLSGRHPWLVTHTVRTGGEPEIWGLDLTSPSPGRVERDGLRVELHLPAPRLLGHGQPTGDNADRVPSYASRELVPDPARRAEELVRWFLSNVIEALPEDIPGAELAVVIDPPAADPAALPGAPAAPVAQ